MSLSKLHGSDLSIRKLMKRNDKMFVLIVEVTIAIFYYYEGEEVFAAFVEAIRE